MNWQAITFDWTHARAFLVTAEEGSLSAAARVLGVTQPTLGRQVAALETALGVSLFDRVGRALKLTETGVVLRDHARRMADAAADLSLAAAGHSQRIEGLVRIAATDVMAHDVLPPLVTQIRSHAPGIEIEIVTSNALSDLRRREADIALRHTRPVEPELICRKMAQTTAHLYASKGWIARHGRPSSVADLAGVSFVAIERSAQMQDFLAGFGIETQIAIVAKNGTVMRELLRHGAGISFLTVEMAAQVAELEMILPDLPPVEVPLWLTAHRDLLTSARVRLVYDLLAQALS